MTERAVRHALCAGAGALLLAALAPIPSTAAGAPPRCDRAASAALAKHGWSLGRAGRYAAAVDAYTASSHAVAACPAADRAAHITAYLEAVHAVIAGAALVTASPHGADDEAVLVTHARALRPRVDLRRATPAQLAAVHDADEWVQRAAVIGPGPIVTPAAAVRPPGS